MQFERRVALRVSAATEMMIRSGASALGVTEAEYIRQCVHAMQTPEEIEAAPAELERPPSPLRPFHVPEGES